VGKSNAKLKKKNRDSGRERVAKKGNHDWGKLYCEKIWERKMKGKSGSGDGLSLPPFKNRWEEGSNRPRKKS